MRHPSLLAVALVTALVAACSKKIEPQKSAAAAPPAPPAAAVVPIERPATPVREGSTVVLGTLAGRSVAFVADADTRAVRTIDLNAEQEIASVALGSRPGQLLLTPGGRLAVALRDDGSVALLDAHADGSLVLAKKTSTALEPVALALSPDDANLFVATGWSHELEAFAIDAQGIGTRVFETTVDREPRAVAVSSDGQRAFVAHAASSKLEEVGLSGKIASTTDLGIAASPMILAEPMPEPPHHVLRRPRAMLDAAIPDVDDSGNDDAALPARFARQAYALAHVEIRVGDETRDTFIVPHTEVMTGDPMVISSGYGGGGLVGVNEPAERFVLSLVDAKTGARTMLSKLGNAPDKTGCHLPRGAATDGVGNVYVACFGSDAIMAFHAGQKTYAEELPSDPRDKLVVNASGEMVAKTHVKKIPYLAVEATGRVPVAAGPSGVALDAAGQRLVAFSQIDGAVSIVSLASFGWTHPSAKTIKLLRSSGLSELAARGRRIFFSGGDARIAEDGRACSSCHPEGRDDGLTWSTPDGPRQTILLAGREKRQGPFGWLGKHASLQVHMETTMKNLKGAGLPLADRDALAAFVSQLDTPAGKWRSLTAEEIHGRDVFQSGDAQCSSCHAPSSGFTDHDTHDVKSATASDKDRSFLVPSLAGVGGSAPYFHDGRYATLEELLDKCDGTMGSTKQMSGADKRALAAYLRTL